MGEPYSDETGEYIPDEKYIDVLPTITERISTGVSAFIQLLPPILLGVYQGMKDRKTQSSLIQIKLLEWEITSLKNKINEEFYDDEDDE